MGGVPRAIAQKLLTLWGGTLPAGENRASRASLERRVSELTTLGESGRLLTSTLDLSQGLQRLAELARVRLGVDVVRIFLREPGADEMRLAAETGVTSRGGASRPRCRSGEEIVGWIVEHREPLVLADVRCDPRVRNRESMTAEGIHSLLGVPIVLDDQVVGVLACSSRTPSAFTADDVLVGRLLALAIRNAQLFVESERRRREAQELAKVAAMLTESLDIPIVAERIVESARTLVGTPISYVGLARPDGALVGIASSGEGRAQWPPGDVVPSGIGVVGRAVTEGRPAWSGDVLHDPDVTLTEDQRRRNLEAGVKAVLAVPLRAKGRAIGALAVHDRVERSFSDAEAVLLQAFADQAALAMENARLVADLRRTLADLAATQDRLVQGEALRAVGQLASGMAHHLNNILAVIRGRVQLLVQTVEDPATRDTLEIVDRAVADAAGVILGVQGFSRARSTGAAGPVDLNQVVQAVLALTEARGLDDAERRGVSVETRFEPGPIPPVAGDPASLRDVLVSLLLNAREALPGSGQVTIRTWAADDRVHCSVTDTGTGMTEEVRRQAVEPFFTTKGPRSRGLGLSTSHGALRRHGGALTIDSAPDRGTTVTISLPALPSPPAGEPTVARPGAPGPRKILVIDDEPAVRATLADLLASRGHDVHQAASGADGVARFRAERHDLVFTDLGMPAMTGVEVAAAIKAQSPATPVVLVTGWGDAQRTKTEWVDRVISKPFDLEAVAAIVETTPAAPREQDPGGGPANAARPASAER